MIVYIITKYNYHHPALIWYMHYVVMFIFHVWMLYIIIITVVSSALTWLCSYFMSECCTSSSQWYLQLVVMFIFHVWMLYIIIIITVVSSARGYVHISCLNAVHHHHHSGIFSSNVVMFIFHVWMLYIIIITVVSSALSVSRDTLEPEAVI